MFFLVNSMNANETETPSKIDVSSSISSTVDGDENSLIFENSNNSTPPHEASSDANSSEVSSESASSEISSNVSENSSTAALDENTDGMPYGFGVLSRPMSTQNNNANTPTTSTPSASDPASVIGDSNASQTTSLQSANTSSQGSTPSGNSTTSQSAVTSQSNATTTPSTSATTPSSSAPTSNTQTTYPGTNTLIPDPSTVNPSTLPSQSGNTSSRPSSTTSQTTQNTQPSQSGTSSTITVAPQTSVNITPSNPSAQSDSTDIYGFNKQSAPYQKLVSTNRFLGVTMKELKQNSDSLLMIVNAANLIPRDYKATIIEAYNGKMDTRVVDPFKLMAYYAMEDKAILWISSSYRTVDEQTEAYNERVNALIRQGYSTDEANILAPHYTEKPYETEHHLGLTLDFNGGLPAFGDSAAYKWLKNHAHEYGFIERFPADKQNITGMRAKPWQWRYVGVEHATKMKSLNMCLEEYVEYLAN